MKPSTPAAASKAIRSAAAGALAALVLAGCSSEPSAPPGGKAAAKAASDAAEAYAKGLRRGIERGKRDRALSDLESARRALEQYAADRSEYPEADSCAALAAALPARGRPAAPERDPWGAAYECRSSREGFSLRSAGEDGAPGSADDVLIEGGSPPGP